MVLLTKLNATLCDAVGTSLGRGTHAGEAKFNAIRRQEICAIIVAFLSSMCVCCAVISAANIPICNANAAKLQMHWLNCFPTTRTKRRQTSVKLKQNAYYLIQNLFVRTIIQSQRVGQSHCADTTAAEIRIEASTGSVFAT